MSDMIMDKTLTLVVAGYEVSGGVAKFKDELNSNSFFPNNGFKNGKIVQLPPPYPNAPGLEIAYRITNDDSLTIEYSLIERRLVIIQKSYDAVNMQMDNSIYEILKKLLTFVPSSSIQAFGINYNTDILREAKLCLFNSKIETELGKPFWDTNIGFKTEIAFESGNYTTMYRIYKNEKLSQEKNGRYYSFDSNFNFNLDTDDKNTKILELFKNNKKYNDIYTETIGKILGL